MEEKAKNGLKSALSFLEGDVVFYLVEAEKHETGAKAKASIRYTQLMMENLIKRIRKQVKEDMPVEKNKCGKCAHVSYCNDTLKYVVPCVRFEERKPDFGKEEEREKKEQHRPTYCESCAYFPYCDNTYKQSRKEEGCAYFEERDYHDLHANR